MQIMRKVLAIAVSVILVGGLTLVLASCAQGALPAVTSTPHVVQKGEAVAQDSATSDVVQQRITEVRVADQIKTLDLNDTRSREFLLEVFNTGTYYQKYVAALKMRQLGPEAELHLRQAYADAKDTEPFLASLFLFQATEISLHDTTTRERTSSLGDLINAEDPYLSYVARIQLAREEEGVLPDTATVQSQQEFSQLKSKAAIGIYLSLKERKQTAASTEVPDLLKSLRESCRSPLQPEKSRAIAARLIEIGAPAVSALLSDLAPAPSSIGTLELYCEYLYAVDIFKGTADVRTMDLLSVLAGKDWLPEGWRHDMATYRAGGFELGEEAEVAIQWIKSEVRYPYLDEIAGWYGKSGS